MRDRTPRSPYAKYGKKPFRYSENYRQWRALTRQHGGSTDTPEHERLNVAHRRAWALGEFAPKPTRKAVKHGVARV